MKSPIVCRSCGSEKTLVHDSRKKDGGIWRVRECRECGERWSTIEVDFWEWKKVMKKVNDNDL